MSDPQTIQALLVGRSLGGSPAKVVPGESADKSQIRELAAQFESMLLSQMLKDLKSSTFDGDDKESTSGFQAGPLGDVINSELGLALSRAGGVGLGQSLMNAMARESGLELGGQPPAGKENEPGAAPAVVRRPGAGL